jgi:hypothetical protein
VAVIDGEEVPGQAAGRAVEAVGRRGSGDHHPEREARTRDGGLGRGAGCPHWEEGDGLDCCSALDEVDAQVELVGASMERRSSAESGSARPRASGSRRAPVLREVGTPATSVLMEVGTRRPSAVPVLQLVHSGEPLPAPCTASREKERMEASLAESQYKARERNRKGNEGEAPLRSALPH